MSDKKDNKSGDSGKGNTTQKPKTKKYLKIRNTVKQLRVLVYTDDSGKELSVRFSNTVEIPYCDGLMRAIGLLQKNGKIMVKTIEK